MSVVLWSGGCDSTWQLYRLACRSTASNPVHALSINHCHVPAYAMQSRARSQILKELRDRSFHIKHTEVKIDLPIEEFYTQKLGLIQPHIWLGTAVQFLGEHEHLYAGYIEGDQVFHHKQDLYAAFDGLQKLGSKYGNLILELEWTTKVDVIKELRKHNLLHLCWWCEADGFRSNPCMYCHSCMTHELAVYELDKLADDMMIKREEQIVAENACKVKERIDPDACMVLSGKRERAIDMVESGPQDKISPGFIVGRPGPVEAHDASLDLKDEVCNNLVMPSEMFKIKSGTHILPPIEQSETA